jgi:hypothetical protein
VGETVNNDDICLSNFNEDIVANYQAISDSCNNYFLSVAVVVTDKIKCNYKIAINDNRNHNVCSNHLSSTFHNII